ncbi:MAG TPA: hypothetical protein VGM05_18275, partial [Planctomycetaceae bacterium]
MFETNLCPRRRKVICKHDSPSPYLGSHLGMFLAPVSPIGVPCNVSIIFIRLNQGLLSPRDGTSIA